MCKNCINNSLKSNTMKVNNTSMYFYFESCYKNHVLVGWTLKDTTANILYNHDILNILGYFLLENKSCYTTYVTVNPCLIKRTPITSFEAFGYGRL